MRRSPLTFALFALSLSACSPQEPTSQVSAALSDGVLLPAYQQWQQSSHFLADTTRAFCAEQSDLIQVRQAFLKELSQWANLQALQIGPLSEGNLAWQVQFWPDKKNLVQRQVENLLKQKPNLSQADLDQASVVVQGLSAYEYVLFDPAIDLHQSEQKQRYCPLLSAIANHQEQLSSSILAQWQAPEGAATQLKQIPNSRYADGQEAISDLLRSQNSALDGMKKKLGAALGRQNKGVVQPYQAEFWRSNASLISLAASLKGAMSLWQGDQQNGIRQLLSPEQHDLAERIDSQYAQTFDYLSQLNATLSELLATEEGRAKLDNLYNQLDQLQRLQGNDLATALGIQLGFNAHDGD